MVQVSQMIAIRRDFSREVTEKIIREKLFKACDETECFVGWLSDLIEERKAALWEFPTGWAIVSVTECCNRRYLFLHCLQGKQLLNENTNQCLSQLARQENCQGIMCETKRQSMVRYLKRFGFLFHKEIYNHWRMEQSGLIPLIKEIFVGETKFSELKES